MAVQKGVSHFVFISVVGVDQNPYFPYYRMKLEVERTIERSIVPYTILRATQFHEFVLRIIQFLDRLPVMTMPKSFLLQPIDIGEVADRLVELALSEPVGHTSDVGGPEVWTAAELAKAYFMAAGRRRRVVEIPVPGKTAWAWREGALLCPDHRYGKIFWEEFLSQTMQRRAAEARRVES
jgi:uncharacterized protein YbjT (DUF2867 family)